MVDVTCQREALLPQNGWRNIKAPSSADNIWSHLHLLILEQSQEERAGFSTLKANIYLFASTLNERKLQLIAAWSRVAELGHTQRKQLPGSIDGFSTHLTSTKFYQPWHETRQLPFSQKYSCLTFR